ncbi:MAG: hypothetical protein RBU37_23790, partial [Myxococcota bacterium]|nr:hypothetical protein [Myxococcota bacterium]
MSLATPSTSWSIFNYWCSLGRINREYDGELGRVSARLEMRGAEAVQRGLLSEDYLKLRLEAFRTLVVEHETARVSEQSLSATCSLAQR